MNEVSTHTCSLKLSAFHVCSLKLYDFITLNAELSNNEVNVMTCFSVCEATNNMHSSTTVRSSRQWPQCSHLPHDPTF